MILIGFTYTFYIYVFAENGPKLGYMVSEPQQAILCWLTILLLLGVLSSFPELLR